MAEINKDYAVSIFELAKETNQEKEFLDGLKLAASEFNNNPDYIELLAAPNIPIDKREELLDEAFASHVPEYILIFLKLLCGNGHIKEFQKCAEEYEKLHKAFEDVSDAQVVSAVALEEAEKSALTKKLEKISGHKVNLHYEVDEKLLGGVVVYMDGMVIDGSLKYKLNEIKEEISK